MGQLTIPNEQHIFHAVQLLFTATFSSFLDVRPFPCPGQSPSASPPIEFELKTIPFRLENGVTPAKNIAEAMLGGVAIFDYNGDGRPDIFFTNGANVARLKKDPAKFRNRLFGGFRDFNNDGYPDLAFAAFIGQTLPMFLNTGNGTFREVTTESGMREASLQMSGYGDGLYDFDNDGWKDPFVTGGHVRSVPLPGQPTDQYNAVFGQSRTHGEMGRAHGKGRVELPRRLPPSRWRLRRSEGRPKGRRRCKKRSQASPHSAGQQSPLQLSWVRYLPGPLACCSAVIRSTIARCFAPSSGRCSL